MQHSVLNIGKDYEKLSNLRDDKAKFNAIDFFQFAKNNPKKYSIIESGNDLLVGTWHSNELIENYKKTLK